MEAWIGWVVRWILTDLHPSTTDVARVDVFDTFREAVEKGRWLATADGVAKVRVQFVTHPYHDGPECDVCMAIYGRGQDYEGPTCGVCDAVGHTTDNCRSGDAPYDYREDMEERESYFLSVVTDPDRRRTGLGNI